MEQDYYKLRNSVISIASELYRFQSVFEKAISKLEFSEQGKYQNQFSWFSKKVNKALEEAGLRLVKVEGQEYDPGMAVTPLNIEEFDVFDKLYVIQQIEPIVMEDDTVIKTGTVILGRVDK